MLVKSSNTCRNTFFTYHHLNKFTVDHWSRILMISISNQTFYPEYLQTFCFKLKPWLFATHLLSLAKLKLILLKFKTSECSLKTLTIP